ncbi:hypothetical protein CSB11_01285 [Candidatus Campbellbacteria bacterium]|nr:MAG: hypothetical protein CSB11_01285 [Candidatus Campbellbacteria bacterium]
MKKEIIKKDITFKMKDKGEIYADFYSSKSKKCIVIIHGLFGNSSEHQFYNSARFFAKKGYDVYALNMYTMGKRQIDKNSITQQVKDLEEIYEKVKRKYQKIFLIGHSIGGPIIYLSKVAQQENKVQACALWEPTINPVGVEKDFKFKKGINAYYTFGFLVSKKMVSDLKKLTSEKISKIKKPFLLVLNTKGGLYKNWKKAYEFIRTDYETLYLKNSGHNFSKNNQDQILYKETLKYFNKF